MNARDASAFSKLQRDYGRNWGITQTDSPNRWFKAVRRRTLHNGEIERGLSKSLIYDTVDLLAEALASQADIEERMAAYNPAYL